MRDVVDDITDGIRERLADATGKQRTGFEPSVCEGCPHRGQGPLRRCRAPSPGQPEGCGCPTLPNLGLDMAQMTPEGCPRASEHARRSE